MNRTMLTLVLVALATTAPSALAKDKKGSSGGAAPPPTAPAQSPEDQAVEFLVTLDNTKFKLSDDDSVTNIRKLLGFWKNKDVSNGTKSKIPSLLHWFGQRKSSPVVIAAVAALGEIGKGPGTSKLVALLDGQMMQKDPPLDQVSAVLGALKNAADPDPAVTRSVMKVFVDRDAVTAGKAVDVFSNYAAAAVDVRKRLFEEILANSESMAAVAAKPDNKTGLARWTALAPFALNALCGISKQSFADIPAARKWFTEQSSASGAWK